jgi:predicted nucleic acid-binding protein
MILADTSAWISYLRATGDATDRAMASIIRKPDAIVTTEVVLMELLAGARSPEHLRQLRSTLLDHPMLTLEGLPDFEEAAVVYRRCRAAGETIRSLTDCLIAAVAMRAEVSVLHVDRDYAAIARHTSLRLEHPR